MKTYGLVDILVAVFYGQYAMPNSVFDDDISFEDGERQSGDLRLLLRVRISSDCCTNFFH